MQEAVEWLTKIITNEYRCAQLAEWEREYGEAFVNQVVKKEGKKK